MAVLAPISSVSYTLYMADVTLASKTYVVIDREGVLTAISGARLTAKGVGAAAITATRNGTLIAGLTGSVGIGVAGGVDLLVVPKQTHFVAGDVLGIVSAGGGTGTTPIMWTVQLRTDRPV